MEKKSPKFFYGYVIVTAAFLILAVAVGSIYTFGVFFKPLSSEFGWTRAMTSGAFSLRMLLSGLLAMMMGRLNDRFGPRVLITVGSLSLGLGFLLSARIDAIWQLYLFFGVMVAMGIGAAVIPLLSTTARWFVKRRGLITGITAAGAGFGTMVAPPIASHLISHYGWRNSFIIIGAVALVLSILAAQFLRRDPAQMGLLPYGESETEPASLNWQTTSLSLQEAIRTKQFWMLWGIVFCFGFHLQTIMVHITPHATELGISAASAANILATIGATSIIGRVILGSAGDRIGYKTAILVCFMLVTAPLFWLIAARETWTLYLIAGIYGLGYGGFTALESPLVAELFGMSSHGVIYGCINFGFTSGSALGPILAGRIFDVTQSYHLAFLICIAVSIAAIILTIPLRPLGKAAAGRV